MLCVPGGVPIAWGVPVAAMQGLFFFFLVIFLYYLYLLVGLLVCVAAGNVAVGVASVIRRVGR